MIEYLGLKPGAHVVDGTLGLGGHGLEILRHIGKSGHYYGFDLDEKNLEVAKERLKEFSSQTTFFHDNFAHCQIRLQEVGVHQVDGILLDLGLSSPHIDEPERGFSVQHDGPLDMRFDRSQGTTAADLVNHLSEDEIKRIIYDYGEEKYAPKIARLIVEQRKEHPFERTSQLTDLIGIFMKSPSDKRKVAVQLFQALRIAVNDELEVLKKALSEALALLAPGGRVVIISYHSLEDRLVKQAFREAARECICPPQVLRCECSGKPSYKLLTKKPVTPSPQELQTNPRSRSAKLRALQRL